jgi:hypothetical protein
MLFNGSKSKLMCFSKAYSPKNVFVKVCGESVPLTDKMNYLGHSISSKIYETPIKDISNDFVIKLNGVLGDFSSVKSGLKHDLMMKYCTSFYGVMFCDFNDKAGLNVLYRQWRKALRKIWLLPNRAHSRLLPLITQGLPLEIVLKRRFLKFFHTGLSSKNNMVQSIFKLASKGYSRLGCNFRAICSSVYNSDGYLACYTIDHIMNNLVDKWRNSIADEDVRSASQIRELVDIRDGISSNLLSRAECQQIIDFVSTM